MDISCHIAADSCTDLTDEMKRDGHICRIPLTLIVGEDKIIDDDTFDQSDFLAKVAAYEKAATSACPSPEDYMLGYGYDNADAYGITLSAELSGSYNSARVGAALIQEEFPNKKVHVFDSKSACCGQTLILMMIQECMNKGLSFEETVDKVEYYISEQTTLFVLESLETLRKNGRLSNLKAALVNVLNIKPIMSSTPDGNIQQLDVGRGMKKALLKMVGYIGKTVIRPEERVIGITHCNCLDKARFVKAEIEKRYPFKDVIIVDAMGVASLYANDGGVVVAF